MNPGQEAIWNIYLRTYTFMYRNKDNFFFGKYKENNKCDLIGHIVFEGIEHKPKYEQVPVDILLTRFPETRNNLIQLNLYPNEDAREYWCEVDNFLVQLQAWYDFTVKSNGWNEKSEESLEKIYLPLLEKVKK